MSTQIQSFCPKCAQTQDAKKASAATSVMWNSYPCSMTRARLSRAFLLARDSCCDSGCRNCPYPTQADIRHKACERCGQTFACLTRDAGARTANRSVDIEVDQAELQ